MIGLEDQITMSDPLPPDFPTKTMLYEPVLRALEELGGSGTNQEIYETVKKNLHLSFDPEDYRHLGSSTQSELYYRIAWAKTDLKAQKRIDNPKKGIWTICSPHPDYSIDDQNELNVDSTDVVGFEPWRKDLLDTLQSMNPYSFEKLAMRLLRECGFESVKVTKKSGDGGIDGFGKLKVNGIFCFNVAFQCKRYSGSVPASDIRDFRGSLTNSIEKGIFITTGSFSNAALNEASDPGKKQIDLINGDDLIDKMGSLELGVKQTFTVDREFFESLDRD